MGMIESRQLDNGLTLLVEPIEGVASVGLTMLTAAGAANEPADRLGVGAVLSEALFRGAGGLDARGHSEALDQLGIKRGCEVQTYHARLSATFIGDRIDGALPLLTDMVRRPRLADASFGPSRDLAVQAIESLEDEPQDKLMIALKHAHLPAPLNRSPMGRIDCLRGMTNEDVRAYFDGAFVAGGSIVAVAGAVDVDDVTRRIEALLGDWAGTGAAPGATDEAERGYQHVHADSTQQHIGIAFDAVPETDARSMTQRVAVAVLSGGMSGRLFTEVREKRGLCYAVHAGYSSLIDRGAVLAYAGTTHERAAETLDVLTGELIRLHDGVERDEFDRAIVGLKSRLVMQGESTSARARAIAHDQFLLGRPRTLDDFAAAIDAVTLDGLNDFLAAHRPGEMTTVTIGPAPLEPAAKGGAA